MEMKNIHLIMRATNRALFVEPHPMSTSVSEASLKLADVELAVRGSVGLAHAAVKQQMGKGHDVAEWINFLFN